MNTLLIIIKPGYDPDSLRYDALYQKLKSTYSIHFSVSQTVYLVQTSDSPEQIYNELFWEHSNKDLLTIMRFQRPVDVWGSQEILNWIGENLPESSETP